MQQNVYTRDAENDEGYQRKRVHLPVKHPQEREAEAVPIPSDTILLSSHDSELGEILDVVIGIRTHEGADFVSSDGVNANGIVLIQVEH
jgi:hypothetical protein